MAFEVTYTDCSAETYQEIRAIIALWNEKSPEYRVKTSGSTGTPKSILLKREQLEASAKRSNAFFGLNEHSRVLMPLSPHTIGGKMMLIRALVGNYSIHVVEPRANPLEEIDHKSRFSFISLVPYQVKSILEETPDSLNRFDCILLGGMGLSLELEKTLSDLSPQIYIGFGMTETVSHIALRKMNNPVYEALEGVELDISEGSLVVTDSKLGIERMQTNDQVKLIDSKHFEWLGRADFVINSGGLKIHPENIEQLIADQIEVPFIIGGIPHETLGEACVLIIEEALPEAQFEQLKALIREKFGKYAAPKQQVIASILKTENGKIRRKETLKALFK
ncbi:AMP-binding protein [Fluviicola sp.]|uniref:AMP-binding protein n=1 Tax=Fluviicola sp. TaxID=1917219 RepID=UPI0031DF258A